MIDFAVIGGGIAGLSAAARLSHLGNVTVLEQEAATAFHASGRSAALFEESYGHPAVVALNRASKAYHETAHGGVLSPRGVMVVGRAADRDAFEADRATLGLEEIGLDEARTMIPVLNPETVAFAGYHPAGWDLDTDLQMQNFIRELRGNGGDIRLRTAPASIVRTGTGWRLEMPEGPLEARILVNAAGAWADTVARLAGIAPKGIVPHRRSIAQLPAPGGEDVASWPMVIGAGETWYAKPDAGRLLVSPADEDPVDPHDAWADEMVLAEGLARYEEMVAEPVTRVLTSWAGLRSFAPDRVLVIGPDPADAHFLWCAGQGGYGFQTAPAASRLLADLAGGTHPDLDPALVAALSPARFAP